LGVGIELGAHVIDFRSDGEERSDAPVRSDTQPQRKSVFAFMTVKDTEWMTAMDWTRPLRNAIGLRKKSK
jgi:hypothetical protein